jgi:hypothetical protein
MQNAAPDYKTLYEISLKKLEEADAKALKKLQEAELKAQRQLEEALQQITGNTNKSCTLPYWKPMLYGRGFLASRPIAGLKGPMKASLRFFTWGHRRKL